MAITSLTRTVLRPIHGPNSYGMPSDIPRVLFWSTFAAAVVILLAPLAFFRYFPSMDGPSHLYNACVLRDYFSNGLYKQYYELRLTPAGNFLGTALLAALLCIFPVSIAAKLPVLLVGLSTPLAFRYFTRSLGRSNDAFTITSFLFVFTLFLQLGFWNFCFGIALFFIASGYMIRRVNWTPRSFSALILLSLLTYATHVVSWMMLFLVSVALVALSVYGRRSEAGIRGRAQPWLPLLCQIPCAGVAIAYLSSEAGRTGLVNTGSFYQRFAPVLRLSFLTSIPSADMLWNKTVAIFLMLTVLVIVAVRAGNWRIRPTDALLVVAMLCAIFGGIGPAAAASGSYIRVRMGLYCWFFVIAWLATQSIGRRASEAICIVSLVLFAWGVYARWKPYRIWNDVLSEYASVFGAIPAGSTVLPVQVQPRLPVSEKVLVTGHALGLLAPTPFIDLGNYEARFPVFVTSWRPEYSPWQVLFRDDFGKPLPAIDVKRYECETHGRVDFILFEGRPTVPGVLPESLPYKSDLSSFELVATSQPTGLVRLYRHVRMSLPAGACHQYARRDPVF